VQYASWRVQRTVNDDGEFGSTMILTPEYRVGFSVLREEVGLWTTLRIAVPAFFEARMNHHKAKPSTDHAEVTKVALKNHFQLLANMYRSVKKLFGQARADEIMQVVLLAGGDVFFRGFTKLDPGECLLDFVRIYKRFESNNIVFDVIEESDQRFEIEIKRCLVFEAFNELGVPSLTQWMCDIAFGYFSRYHPCMTYEKDRMIARGADRCHEIFTWHSIFLFTT